MVTGGSTTASCPAGHLCWPEVSDLCHTFFTLLVNARVKKPTAIRELHANLVQFSHCRGLACYSRKDICFFTRATCDKIQYLWPLPTSQAIWLQKFYTICYVENLTMDWTTLHNILYDVTVFPRYNQNACINFWFQCLLRLPSPAAGPLPPLDSDDKREL